MIVFKRFFVIVVKFMLKISRYIRNASFFYAFCILAIVELCFIFVYWLVYFQLFGGNDIIFVEEPYAFIQTYGEFVFMALVGAPLLETLIFQTGAYHLLKRLKWLRRRKYYIVVISGALFGLTHLFSLSHLIVATILGFFFMYVYIIRYRRGGFWLVVLLHAFYNGIGLLLEHFELF